MSKQNLDDLGEAIKKQQEEIARLKKKVKRQKWWNVFWIWSKL